MNKRIAERAGTFAPGSLTNPDGGRDHIKKAGSTQTETAARSIALR